MGKSKREPMLRISAGARLQVTFLKLSLNQIIDQSRQDAFRTHRPLSVSRAIGKNRY